MGGEKIASNTVHNEPERAIHYSQYTTEGISVVAKRRHQSRYENDEEKTEYDFHEEESWRFFWRARKTVTCSGVRSLKSAGLRPIQPISL